MTGRSPNFQGFFSRCRSAPLWPLLGLARFGADRPSPEVQFRAMDASSEQTRDDP
ncbi:MAG TPA: hypothetical protein V6D46_04610 [Coleofasciculaceae cyanobacterium]